MIEQQEVAKPRIVHREAQALSEEVLHLLADALELGLHVDHAVGDPGIVGLGADGVHLAPELLHQEVELAADALAARREACARTRRGGSRAASAPRRCPTGPRTRPPPARACRVELDAGALEQLLDALAAGAGVRLDNMRAAGSQSPGPAAQQTPAGRRGRRASAAPSRPRMAWSSAAACSVALAQRALAARRAATAVTTKMPGTENTADSGTGSPGASSSRSCSRAAA